MRLRRPIVAAFAVGTFATATLFAHHGAANYDSRTITLQGTITRFELVSPGEYE